MKQKIIIATSNEHKILEYKKLLTEYKVLSLKDIKFFGEIEENGKTFLENSLIKAKTISLFLQNKNIFVPVLADDSGLCVNALNGEPGIYSARYSGGHGNYKENRDYLLKNLKGVKDRSAFFECVLVKYYPDGHYNYGDGKVFGKILEQEEGDTSFGYDCLFYSNELEKSFGVATKEEKNSVSHRINAIIDLRKKENTI